jgi:hypothetical protein
MLTATAYGKTNPALLFFGKPHSGFAFPVGAGNVDVSR